MSQLTGRFARVFLVVMATLAARWAAAAPPTPATAPAGPATAPAADGAAQHRADVEALRGWWYGGRPPPPAKADLDRFARWVAAHQDGGEAAFFLGLLHDRNVPAVDPQPVLGRVLNDRAGDLRFGPAWARAGLRKLVGRTAAERDPEGGLRMLTAEDDRGDPDAPDYLAGAFLAGWGGLRVDADKARACARRALDRGNVRAHATMAAAYLLADDADKALAELRAGGDAGDQESMRNLAAYLATGTKMARDQRAARAWALEGAERGSRPAQALLGHLYRAGEGGPADPMRAGGWLQLAARGGDVGAKRELAQMYLAGEGSPPQVGRAVGLLKELAEAGDAESQVVLAKLYLQGVLVPSDAAEAKRLLAAAAAADAGSWSAEAAAYLRWIGRPGPPPAGPDGKGP